MFSEVLSLLDDQIIAPDGGGDDVDNVHVPDIPHYNSGQFTIMENFLFLLLTNIWWFSR